MRFILVAALILLIAYAIMFLTGYDKPIERINTGGMVHNAQAEEAITFGLPIDCELNTTCFIQNYVDMEPGEGYKNYTCDHHSYDNHKGTDFRLLTEASLKDDVDVLAARDGTVANIRDEVPDINRRENPAYDDTKGCGNVVILRHEQGYTTWYCHMKRGSIRVKKGDSVKAGDVLGTVGLSGNTVFPHLHFAIQKNGEHYDPFTGNRMETSCDQPATRNLWNRDAQKKLEGHRKTAILTVGINGDVPDTDAIKKGTQPPRSLQPDSRALLGWIYIMGPKKDDLIQLTITFPNGNTRVLDHALPKNKAEYVLFSGIKRKTDRWEKGTYQFAFELVRGKKVIDRRVIEHRL